MPAKSHPRATPNRRRALALAVHVALASLPLYATAASTGQQQVQRYDIASGPLGTVLSRYAQAAGVSISFSSQQVGSLSSQGLKGSYSVGEGFARILQGSGWTVQAGVDGYVLVAAGPAGAVELGATSIAGERLDSTTEHTGSYTQTGPSSTANGLNLSLRETPQSVTVLTRQRMDDENVRSLQDVATTVTGLSYVQVGSERPTFFSRGFSVNNLQYDGVSSGLIVEGAMDAMETLSLDNMVVYDRVEVVRGANGLLQGAGNPSAAINLVRKRPTREFQLSTQLGMGSWDNYSSQIDVSGPLNENASLRGRAVAYYNDRNSFRDDMGKENQLVYLIGEMDITESTLLSLGGSVQKDNSGGYDWGGLPYKADGTNYTDVSRSTSLQGDWTYLDKTNYQLFSEVSHVFANGWKVSAKSNNVWSQAEFLSSYADRYSGDTFTLNYLYQDYKASTSGFSLSGSGPFELFGRQHDAMLGANYDKSEYVLRNQGYADQAWTESVVVDIYNPDLSSVARPTFNTWLKHSGATVESKGKGMFSAVRLSLTDRTKFILGARVSDYEYQADGSANKSESGVVTPYGGVVYQLDSNHSLYASYTDIFSPQNLYSPDGSRLDPLLGSNYEFGLKSEFWDGRLNTSFAVFQIDQENLGAALGDQPRTCGPSGTSTCYRAVEKAKNRGFEVEASGEITPDWKVALGYTYSNPEASDGTDITNFAPENLFKLSTGYKLSGRLEDWTVGGNIHSQSKVSVNFREQERYTLLHLRTAYKVNEDVSVQYALRNVFDKKYYIYDTTFGEPRNFMITINYSM